VSVVEPVPAARIVTAGRLDPSQVAAVLALVDAATATDGARPLSEHVLLHLRYGGEAPVRNVLLYEPGGRLAAYAHLDVTDPVEGSSAEMVVHPEHRRRGYGRRVVERLLTESPDGRLRLWAHGGHPAAARLAHSMGFEHDRSLWQMRRSLRDPIPDVPLPQGVRVRSFEPGRDDAAWVALNAKAFADHPEQGRLTLEDLHQRMAEAWFDPAGFFLAERDEPRRPRLVGFHWTKVHGAQEHGHEPIGEVYVVGVDPVEQGRGLGAALTAVGLAHLRDRGLPQVMLYVDESNVAAVRVYERMGFTHWDTDVMFSRS